jgi:hypothetical protein
MSKESLDYFVYLGRKIGDWEIIDATIYKKDRIKYVMCECKCKKVKMLLRINSLKYNKTSGCASCSVTKYCHKKLHDVWNAIKYRCNNKNSEAYYRYGERGIEICEEWMNFDNFYDWCMNNGWIEGLEIDRINPHGNYEPSNCRLVTRKQNCYNKSKIKKCSSKYKGVSWNKRLNKWRAKITKDGKNTNIGLFSHESEAALAYNEKAKELFGEYAYLNKIEE